MLLHLPRMEGHGTVPRVKNGPALAGHGAEAEKIKSTIRERGSLKVIDKVTVKLNEKRDVYEALLSNLGTKGVEIGTGTGSL